MDDHLHRHRLPDGRELTVYRFAFNDRVVIGPPQPAATYDLGWCYPAGTAVAQVADWDGVGPPPGLWLKDLQTGEYGPGFVELGRTIHA